MGRVDRHYRFSMKTMENLTFLKKLEGSGVVLKNGKRPRLETKVIEDAIRSYASAKKKETFGMDTNNDVSTLNLIEDEEENKFYVMDISNNLYTKEDVRKLFPAQYSLFEREGWPRPFQKKIN